MAATLQVHTLSSSLSYYLYPLQVAVLVVAGLLATLSPAQGRGEVRRRRWSSCNQCGGGGGGGYGGGGGGGGE